MTGNNTVTGVGGKLSTGDARAVTKSISYLNTTLIGNKWYLADLNLLAPLKGNIISAKPDLQMGTSLPEQSLYKGQRAVIGFTIKNQGLSDARNVEVQVNVPDSLKILGVSPDAHTSGNTIVWKMSALTVGRESTVWLAAEALSDTGEAVVTAGVKGEYSELALTNNSASTRFVFKTRPSVVAVPMPTPTLRPRRVMRPQPTPTSQTVAYRAPVVHADTEGEVLGERTELAVALPSETVTSRLSFCQRNSLVCNGIRYGLMAGLTGLWIYKRRLKVL